MKFMQMQIFVAFLIIKWLKEIPTLRNRTGFVIVFAKCPVIWASKLQTKFAFSSAESECISLSTALREVIPLVGLLKEFKEQGTVTDQHVPKVCCKAFKDNLGAYELARAPMMPPRTKHVNQKCHHFRS